MIKLVKATIVITTKDRKDDLRKALRSAFAQTVRCEVLVTDDASSDGTAAMVSEEFPEARLLRSAIGIGLIAQRNRAARVATTEFIFSIDDDAEFGSPDTVEQTLAEFDEPGVGAVAIPQIDTPTRKVVNAPAPDDGQVWCVAAFVGTAYAVRRSLFLQLGGYREQLVHQGEESDFCIRMLAGGSVVRLGMAPMIQHHESPRRSYERMDFYGRRNDVLFAWHNVPSAYLPLHLAATTVNGLRWAFKVGRVKGMIRGLLMGYVDSLRLWDMRAAVPARVYWLFRKLKKQGPVRLKEIEVGFVDGRTETLGKKRGVLDVASYWSHTFLPGLIRADGIVFDFGVNSGGFADLVAGQCARVVGFEPDPSWHGKYRFRGNVTIVNKAVAARRGVLRLNVNPTQCSSLHYAEAGAMVAEVEAVTLEDALALDPDARIEVLKMDIEGEEVAVLQGAPAALFKRVAQITVEFHDFLDSASVPGIKQVIRRLEDLGFVAFRMSWRSYGDMLFVNQALEPLTLMQRIYLGIWYKYSRGIGRILGRLLGTGERGR